MATFPRPSKLWCTWQSLKGTNNTQLPTPEADLRGKIVIVTGGNNGIGREAALQFARCGASIILGCRHPPPHETPPGVTVEECKAVAQGANHVSSTFEWWECDMANFASVEAFAKRWLATSRRLDILCNNAGTATAPGDIIMTKDGNELLHQVNFLSHVLLTMYLLPSLAKAPEPRMVFTTSCMQYFGTFNLDEPNKGDNGYSEAKIFLQTFLTELQSRMLDHEEYRHITAQGIHPGYVQTGIWKGAKADGVGTIQVQKTKTEAQLGWISWILAIVTKNFGIDAQQGSLAIFNAATQPECGPDPSRQGVGAANGKGGGRYFNRIWEAEPMPQTKAKVTRDLLWKYLVTKLELRQRGLLAVVDP